MIILHGAVNPTSALDTVAFRAYSAGMTYDNSPAYQRLGAVIGFLGLTERAAAVELGMTRHAVRALLRGELVPSYEEKARIHALSCRAPMGAIFGGDWPAKVEPPVKQVKAKAGRK